MSDKPTATIANTPKGIMTALTAFLIWGNFPFYFKLLDTYHAIEVIFHRVFWTFILLFFVMIITKRIQPFLLLKQQPKWLLFTCLSGILITTNWLTYVWAVNTDHILEASLGYYISPLTGILLSFFLLKEKLRQWQFIAIMLASLAVIIQIIWLGKIPYISLLLAGSFSIYGVMQRKTPLDAISVLFFETLFVLPFGFWWLSQADVASSRLDFWLSSDIWLLMLAGPITLVPLLLYNKSTKMVSFNTLSFMNYLSPSMIFLSAVLYYQEPFDMKRLFVFGLIWLGLLIFSVDMVKHRKVG